MGNACTPYRSRTALVRLHVYDYTGKPVVSGANAVLHAVGSGAYHVGVEVHGQEWSYRRTEDGSSGVFSRPPRESDEHTYREAERMGRTELSQREVDTLLQELSQEWLGRDYSLLRQNSGHFCNELCRQLGVGPLPDWVMSLASRGATVEDTVQQVKSDVQALSGAVRTKAEELDQRFHLTEKAGAVAAKTRELDARLGLSGAAAVAADKAKAAAATAAERTSDLVRHGKEARGVSESEGYRFGDVTRGVVRSALGNKDSPEGGQGYRFGDLTRGLVQSATAAGGSTAQPAAQPAGLGQGAPAV
eukprot:CAMPEP_0197881216 /NCGR_PEP_ID=MMETSP1439-20131203/8779_1 /TAXON_ID=66791 /ORGANISM="Gonyaulax spinifera, Strain CCMP409" /LENGTH=303 /DNA_ID=CAMNT_0043500813 /DNA_START=51 /DNA_END=962 /DNA_ORIENTATION=+